MDIEFAKAMADLARAELRRLGKEMAEARRGLESWKAKIKEAPCPKR